MNYQALLDSIASGAVASGDLQSWKPGPAGPDALEQGIQAFTGQPEIHSTVLLRLTDRILDIFQAVNLTFVGTTWVLVESTLETAGTKIIANGPTVRGIETRLANEGHICENIHWNVPCTDSECESMALAAAALIAAGTVYGVGEIALLAPWKAIINAQMKVVAIAQWQYDNQGWFHWAFGGFLGWQLKAAQARLATILAHPPIPVFKEIVCSPFASQLAVAAGKADLNADGLVNGLDTRLTWGETPGDLLSLPGTTVNVIE